jgi:CDGSH-type Zn-finger protein
LHYERVDGGPAETPDVPDTIRVQPHGPYYVRGQLRVVTADGALLIEDARLALCRCGQSQHKPFCDNAHLAAGFDDPGHVPPNADAAAPEQRELLIKTRKDGPLKLDGPFELIGFTAQGDEAVYRADEAVLCRCGGSANKPFCDGTHKHIGFQAE